MQDSTRIWLGNALFAAVFLLNWIGFDIYRSNEIVLSSESGPLENSFNYQLFLVFLIISTSMIYKMEREILKITVTPVLIAMLIWLLISSLISINRAVSLKAYMLFLISFTLYMTLFLLPSNRNSLANILGGVMLLVLLLSYIGFIFIPNGSIHQASDYSENHLAGDLRGIWTHKNRAGPALATMIFISIFLSLVKKYAMAIIIFIFAGFFFVFTGAKTSQMAFFLTLMTAVPALYFNSAFIRNAMLLAPILLLNFLGAGSMIITSLQPILNALPIDPTFTGRTETWAIMLENIQGHLLFGQGYASFWTSEYIKNARIENKTRGVWANHGHQGLFDLALNIGLIGMVLFMLWAIYQPLKDIGLALKKGHDRATILLLVLLWQYWLTIGAMESIFLERLGLEWFMLAFSIFGLRYMSQYDINKGDHAL